VTRVLDIDLDFFLDAIVFWPQGDERPGDDEGYDPWPEDAVRAFLESRCLLTTSSPTSGAAFAEHFEVFDDWKTRIASGALTPPFDVVHVDAHADLGLGDASYMTLATDLLGLDVSARSDPPRDGLSGLASGNYLAFAAACRWLKTLTYVHHPDGGDDLPRSLMKNWDHASGALQLKFFGKSGKQHDVMNGTSAPLALEPAIPICVVNGSDYQATQPFDLVFLAQSPLYSPPSADALIDVISSYIAS
jgi:hypothetical protein